jgi:hypothetical protein
MTQPFRMLDLPTKLVRQICMDRSFDRHDLMALRLTCRLMCEFSTEPFDDECFTGVSVLLTRRSLQALIEILKHSRIRPRIQAITLTPLRTFPEALSSLLPTNNSVYRTGDLAKAKASANLVYQYLDRYHEEMELEQSGDTLRLLTEAFASLEDDGDSLYLEVSDVEDSLIGAQGCFSRALVEFDKEKTVFRMRWKEAMGFLIKAMIDSGLRAGRLTLFNGTNADLIGGGELWDGGLDEDVNRLSASLTAFDVDVRLHDTDAALKSVKQVVSQADNLKIFTFQRLGLQFFSDLVEISDAITSDSLDCIAISHLYCTPLDLISFLSKHKSTLVSFWLSCSRLQGSWSSLVEWIRSNLTFLRTFGMQAIFDDEYRPPHHPKPVRICHFVEIEDMSTALERLLAKTNDQEAENTDDPH